MENRSQFRLLAGTLLHDPVNRDVRYMLTPRRLAEQGDELALRHLAHNPRAADYFEKPLPENLDCMIAAYLEREAAAAEGVSAPKAERRAAKKGIVRKGTPRTKAKAEIEDESTVPAEKEPVQEDESTVPAEKEPVQQDGSTGKTPEEPSQQDESAGPPEQQAAAETPDGMQEIPDGTQESPDGMQAAGKAAEA